MKKVLLLLINNALLILLMLIICLKQPTFAETISTTDNSTNLNKVEENSTPVIFEDNLITLKLFKQNYVLPFYNTNKPYYSAYTNRTPYNLPLNRIEFKGQLSFLIPIINNIYNSNTSLNFGYTQLMYWQVYNKSQFFRENNYEPEIFLKHYYKNNWETDFGVIHQSNGVGGDFERSWNRIYIQQVYKTKYLYIGIKPWLLIAQSKSSNLFNPDIDKYLGYGEINLAYKFKKLQVSATLRNNLFSGFKRGGNLFGVSYPIFGGFNAYAQLFTGYGQSLIEYNHYTNSFGIGITLNNLV